MPTKLENQPEEDENIKPRFTDDRPQGIYDEQFDKQIRGDYPDGDPEYREQAGGEPSGEESNEASSKKSLGRDELAKAENDADAGSSSAVPEEEKSQTGNNKEEDNFGYRDEGKKRPRFRVTRNQGIAGGAVALFAIGTISLFGFLQGPLQIVHFSQLLQRFHFLSDQEFMDGRAGKLIKYARTHNTPQDRQLGLLANKIAIHYEKALKTAGMEPVYEGGNTGRLNAVIVDADTAEGKKVIEDMRARGVEEFDIQGDGRTRINLDDANPRTRRLALSGMVDSLEVNKVSSSVASRLLKIRAQVDFHPLKNVSRRADEEFFNYVKERQKVRDDELRNGSKETVPGGVTTEDTDADPTNNSPDAASAAEQANTQLGDLPAPDAPTEEIEAAGRSIKGKLAAGTGAAGTVALVCGLNKLGKQIPDLKYANLVAPLIRIGVETMSMGNQVMSGQDMNLDELGAMTKQLYQVERKVQNDDGTTQTIPASSWAGARSVQAENGQDPIGPDMPDSAKPNTKTPQFFEVLNNVISKIPGANLACNAVTSNVGSWALNVVSWASNAGGPAEIVLNIASDLATSAIIASHTDDLVRWLIGSPLALDVGGALFGNYANYGAMLAANDASISHGGIALNDTQANALKQEQNDMLKKELQHESLYARYLNLKQPDSLASRAFFSPGGEQLTNPSATFASLVSSPLKIFSGMLHNFTPKASAASSYSYGFPEFGFSAEERDADAYDNPMENAEQVEPNLAALNVKYGNCFNTTVDPASGKIISKNQSVRYDDLDATCEDHSNTELTRYRFYLADMTTAKSLDCYQGDEESCSELGFNTSTSTSSNTAQDDFTPSDIVTGDTSNVACEAGTDGGIADGHDDGKLIKIRLCNVQGIVVNSQISKQVDALMTAAKSAGLNMRGGGYRSYDQQVRLRQANGCPDISTSPSSSCAVPTARPGFSNHEMGLAIDFTCNGSTIPNETTQGNRKVSPSNACWVWLEGNAGRYGLLPLRTEAWHWSVDGR